MPPLLYVPIGILIITAALGIFTGITLIQDPSGKSMGMDSILPSIPVVSDFLLVGLWLLIVYGIYPAINATGLIFRRRWAFYATVVLAAIEFVWIAAQLVLLYQIGFSPWQAIIPILATITLIILYVPSVRSAFQGYARGETTGSSG